MSEHELTKEILGHIVERILDYANDAFDDASKNPSDLFFSGKRLAYNEILDVLQIELEVNGEDLKDYGLEKKTVKTA